MLTMSWSSRVVWSNAGRIGLGMVTFAVIAATARAAARAPGCPSPSPGLRHDGMVRAGDLVLQLHDPIDHGLRTRRAAGNVDVDRQDLVDALQHRIIVVEAARGGAYTEGHHPLGLAHLL